MRDSQELHKTIIRDIVSLNEDSSIGDIINLINRGAEFGNKFINTRSCSINKRVSDLVLVFPVLVSTSLKMETAILISKAIERKCISMMQLLLSSVNLYSHTDVKDIYDFIGKYHKNINTSGVTLDDFINAMDSMVSNREAVVVDKDSYNAVMECMKGINTTAKNALRETAVNDYEINKTMYGRVNVTLEANNNGSNNDQGRLIRQQGARPEIISDDIKKANELLPTLMTVNYITKLDNGTVERSGVIGIKAKMYPVDHTEIIGRLSSKYSDNNTLFSLIRCSTKEKSFFKDFAFALEKTKWDAVNIAKGSVNSKMFKLLERRAAKNKLKMLKIGDGSPITSLVISQEEVEYLKKYSNMDLEKINTARVILNGYNLMRIVIVDDSLEIAKFLEDNEGIFETLTYDALAKEDKNGDYKKIVNLMAQLNR